MINSKKVNMELKTKIGHTIRTARKDKNISQVTLSEKSKISQHSISLIEAGKLNFKLSTLLRIADILDLKVDFIIK